MLRKPCLLASTIALLWTATLHAQLITPASLTVNSSVEFFPAANLINDSGLLNADGLPDIPTLGNYASFTHEAASDITAWVTDDRNGATGDYFNPAPDLPQFVLGLGSVQQLTGVVTWGYHFDAPVRNEAKTFLLEFSTNGGATYPQSINVTKPNVAAAANTQSFNASFAADTVRITFTDNFFGEGPGGGGDRVGLGELKFLGPNLGFHLQVDRGTGAMTLRNTGTTPMTFKGVSIISAAGGLNNPGWLSIAGNYDSNSGGSVDPNNVWNELSRSSSNLAESTAGSATIAGNASINYGPAWRKSPYEDVVATATLGDGTTLALPIAYVGNGGAPFHIADLNFDGQITSADWAPYRAGYGQELTGLSQAQAYAMGDLNGDGVNNVVDFGVFKTAYDAANGAGAFAAMIAAPEPAGCALLAVGGAWLVRRRPARRMLPGALALLLVALLAAPSQATLLGHWTFENPLDLGLDSAGGDNNGAGGADAAFTVNSAIGVGSLRVDGSGTGLQVANSATFQSLTTFTIAAFVNADLDSAEYGFVGRPFSSLRTPTGSGTSDGYGFGVLKSGGLRYTTYGIQDYDTDPVNGAVLADSWTHVAVVVTEGVAEFYIGGTSVQTIEGGNPNPTIDAFHIGAGSVFATDPFRGAIDDLRVYDEALSAASIGALANSFNPSRLTLEVNTTTGAARIFNSTGIAFTLDQYEITSAGDSLSAGGWGSIANPTSGFPTGNGAGNGWEKLGTPDSDLLAEAYLQGESSFANALSIPLGLPFNTSVNAQDLRFTYRLPSGEVLDGKVTYVSGGFLPADFNNSGAVNAADLTAWKIGFGAHTAAKADGDADGDADVDGTDFLIWQRQLGRTSSAAAVPEPALLALAAPAVLAVARRRPRRRSRQGSCRQPLV